MTQPQVIVNAREAEKESSRNMSELPNCEDEDNWTVFLFDCPKTKIDRLMGALFKLAKEIVKNSLPNYTMRGWNENSVKVSFNVLRDKNDRQDISRLKNGILDILRKENIQPIIDPRGEDRATSGWSSASLSKCKAYNMLSEFVVNLSQDNLFSPDNRNEMRHLAINMLFMREAIRRNAPDPYAFFVDLISGGIFPQPGPCQF